MWKSIFGQVNYAIVILKPTYICDHPREKAVYNRWTGLSGLDLWTGIVDSYSTQPRAHTPSLYARPPPQYHGRLLKLHVYTQDSTGLHAL